MQQQQPPFSSFRAYCQEKFMEHKDEVYYWEKKFPEYDAAYYFKQHRWMLKKMFQNQQLGVDKPTIR